MLQEGASLQGSLGNGGQNCWLKDSPDNFYRKGYGRRLGKQQDELTIPDSVSILSMGACHASSHHFFSANKLNLLITQRLILKIFREKLLRQFSRICIASSNLS